MIELNVCIGSACHLRGSYNIVQTFQQLIEDNKLNDKIDLKTAFCMEKCEKPGVSVSINGVKYNVAPEKAREFFKQNVLSAL